MTNEIKEILDDLDYCKNRKRGNISLKSSECDELLDYITNLQEKIDQYENPDDLTLFYMWIDTKAKDKMKQLQEENMRLISENETIKNIKYTVDETIYKSRVDKAIAYINNELLPYGDEWHWDDVCIRDYICDLLTILNPKRK